LHGGVGDRRVREALSRVCDLGSRGPNIQVLSVNLCADRSMTLRHFHHDDGQLHESADEVLEHLVRQRASAGNSRA
jgi:stage V sporulation protein R